MGNAVKFTERGHVQLRVNDEQCRLHLTIQDTGIGIAQDKLERIFDPFAQADASTTRRFGGTGLGTTISRQLVQLMSGAISVSSREGEGTQFHVQLPLPIGQAPIDEAVASAVQLPPLHILAADDVPQNLELLQVVMQRHGHQVVSASDGLQALQLRQEMARVLQGRTVSESGKHQPAAGASAVPAVLAHAAAESEVVDWHTGLQLWGSEAAPALAPAAIAAEAGLSAAARTQVQEALQALTEALQGGEIDSEALQQLQQLLPEAMVAALQAAIDMFGFDQALQCAQALASSVSTSSDSERKPPHAAQA